MSAFELRKTIYYLESIQRQLTSVAEAIEGPSLSGEILADNRDWLDCYIDYLRAKLPAPPATSDIGR